MDLTTIGLVAAGALGTPLVVYLFKIIDAKIANVDNPRLRNALDELSDSTEAAVISALDTTVKVAKDGGKWDEKVAAKVKQEVIESAIASVSDTAKKQLVTNFKDEQLAEKVGNLVEVSLGKIKERRATKPTRRRTRKASK